MRDTVMRVAGARHQHRRTGCSTTGHATASRVRHMDAMSLTLLRRPAGMATAHGDLGPLRPVHPFRCMGDPV